MEDEIKISDDGELLAIAIEQMLDHAEQHSCLECLARGQTVMRAIEAWVKSSREEKPTMLERLLGKR